MHLFFSAHSQTLLYLMNLEQGYAYKKLKQPSQTRYKPQYNM
jgi:hypothetical protein